jgi:hypothetical protein
MPVHCWRHRNGMLTNSLIAGGDANLSGLGTIC